MKVFDSLADRWRFHRHFRGHHASLHHTGSRVLLVPLLPDCADGRRRRLYHRRKTNHGRQHLTSILFLKLKIINWRKREREREKKEKKNGMMSLVIHVLYFSCFFIRLLDSIETRFISTKTVSFSFEDLSFLRDERKKEIVYVRQLNWLLICWIVVNEFRLDSKLLCGRYDGWFW